MTVQDATQLGRQALLVSMMVGGPALLTVLIVGSVVSLLQAVTQVHEATLTFLPKFIAVAAVLAVSAGWMLVELKSFGEQCFEQISLVGS